MMRPKNLSFTYKPSQTQACPKESRRARTRRAIVKDQVCNLPLVTQRNFLSLSKGGEKTWVKLRRGWVRGALVREKKNAE